MQDNHLAGVLGHLCQPLLRSPPRPVGAFRGSLRRLHLQPPIFIVMIFNLIMITIIHFEAPSTFSSLTNQSRIMAVSIIKSCTLKSAPHSFTSPTKTCPSETINLNRRCLKEENQDLYLGFLITAGVQLPGYVYVILTLERPMFGRKRYSNVKISNLKSDFKGRCAFSSSSPAPVSPPTLSSLQPSPTPELLSQSSEGWCKIILVQLFLVQHNYFANCSYKTQNISKI